MPFKNFHIWVRFKRKLITLVGSMMPFSIIFTYSLFIASYPISLSSSSTLATTTEASVPAFFAICMQGVRKALRTMSTPVKSEIHYFQINFWSCPWKTNSCSVSKEILSFAGPKDSIPCSQQPITGPYTGARWIQNHTFKSYFWWSSQKWPLPSTFYNQNFVCTPSFAMSMNLKMSWNTLKV